MQAVDPANSTFGSRLAEAIDRTGLSRSRLAQEVGASKNTVLNAVNDERLPRVDLLTRLHERMPHLDLHYLLTGERRADVGFGESLSAPLQRKPSMHLWVARAGDIVERESLEDFFDLDIAEDYPLAEEWDKSSFYVQGDSMSPTIEQGEVVMAERVRDREGFVAGAVYMVLAEGQLLCKRVIDDPERPDRYVLRSDNGIYPPRPVNKGGVKLWRVRHRITSKNLGGG